MIYFVFFRVVEASFLVYVLLRQLRLVDYHFVLNSEFRGLIAVSNRVVIYNITSKAESGALKVTSFRFWS